jgi:hypothetical protein
MIDGKTLTGWCIYHSSQDTNYCRVRFGYEFDSGVQAIVTERLAPSEYYIYSNTWNTSIFRPPVSVVYILSVK